MNMVERDPELVAKEQHLAKTRFLNQIVCKLVRRLDQHPSEVIQTTLVLITAQDN